MGFSLLNYDNVEFEGRLQGMKTIFMKIDPASKDYIPAKAYASRYERGQAARTMDVIYEALRIYKGTLPDYEGFVADTTKGFISEIRKGDNTLCVMMPKKKDGTYYIKGSVIDSSDITVGLTLNKGDKDAKILLLFTLLPLILQDEEAHDIYDTMSDFLEWNVDSEDWIFNDHVEEFSRLLNRFSCNVEMQLSGPSASILIDTDKQPSMLKQAEMTGLSLNRVFCGKATRFSFEKTKIAIPVVNKNASFEGSYRYEENREFTEAEKSLIAKVSSKYVMPDWVPEICEYFKESTLFPAPMRVAYLIGPAGTGKTEAANTIAAGLGLPMDHYTCNPSTEIFDFIGQVFPNTADEALDFEEVRKKMGLPSTEDVINDPQGTYRAVFGKEPSSITDEGEIIAEMVQRVMKEVAKSSSGKNFTYVESGLIKAARMGYCFEIQEIGCVLRPGVAVGLNALLETGGNAFITLPTGEVIKKHPDCTFIFTSNDEYEGCCNLNQSVLDRMSLVYRIENPPKTAMKERIMSRLSFPDEKILERMIDVIYDISKAAKDRGIEDGVCGYRALENWAMAAMIKAKRNNGVITDAIVYTTAIQTVMNKTSQKKEYVEELMSSLTFQFAAPKFV